MFKNVHINLHSIIKDQWPHLICWPLHGSQQITQVENLSDCPSHMFTLAYIHRYEGKVAMVNVVMC